jgi:hypothetical protein
MIKSTLPSLSNEKTEITFTPQKSHENYNIDCKKEGESKNSEELLNSSSTYFCSTSKEDNEVSDFKQRLSEISNIKGFSISKVYDFKNIKFCEKNTKIEEDKDFLYIPLINIDVIIKSILQTVMKNLESNKFKISFSSFRIDSSLNVFYSDNYEDENEIEFNRKGYESPEEILGFTPDKKSAIWTLGTILLSIIVGNNPFYSESSILSLFKIFKYFGTPSSKNAEVLTTLKYFSTDFPLFEPKESLSVIENIYTINSIDKNCIDSKITLLISKMLNLNYEKRITLEEAYQSLL